MKRDEIKEKLKKEGLFDEKYKKELPKMPNKIGIVTSPNGAAIKDIMNVIKRRFPISIVIAPVRVQGDEASIEISNAIKKLNERNDIDLIIVGRGGGSWEDLRAFNDERVARAIFSSHIPIISAVGHETDFTISDFVADVRAPTPSAAAEIAVPKREDILERIENMASRILKISINKIEGGKNTLNGILNRKPFKYPYEMINEKIDKYSILKDRMISIINSIIEKLKQEIEMKEELLKLYNPYKILDRGYAIAMLENNEIFKSVDDIKVGDNIKVIVKDGEAKCMVKEKKKK